MVSEIDLNGFLSAEGRMLIEDYPIEPSDDDWSYESESTPDDISYNSDTSESSYDAGDGTQSEGEDEEGEEREESDEEGSETEDAEVPRTAFTPDELTILRNGKAQWMGCKGAPRKKLFDEMKKQLQKVPGIKSLAADRWNIRVKAYSTWLYNQSRNGGAQSRIKIGRAWNIRSVIQEQQKNEINKIIEKQYRQKSGTVGALKVYQKAVRRVMGKLTEEQRNEAEETAAEWNLAKGPPDGVKARNAARHGQKVFREFALEMWRACGMRVVVLAGWKDEQQKMVTAIGDFSEEIHGGEPFAAISQVTTDWEDFIEKCLDPAKDETGDEPRGTLPAKRAPRKDPCLTVTRDDGSIWVPEIRSLNRTALQAIVRGFLTAHYREACGRPNANAPFKRLAKYGLQMVAARHLPPNFTFPGDPSHMHVSVITELLQFLRDRQESHPEDPFSFDYWLDKDNNLKTPGEVEIEHVETDLEESWVMDDVDGEQHGNKGPKNPPPRSQTPGIWGGNHVKGGNVPSKIQDDLEESGGTTSEEDSELSERPTRVTVTHLKVPVACESEDDALPIRPPRPSQVKPRSQTPHSAIPQADRGHEAPPSKPSGQIGRKVPSSASQAHPPGKTGNGVEGKQKQDPARAEIAGDEAGVASASGKLQNIEAKTKNAGVAMQRRETADRSTHEAASAPSPSESKAAAAITARPLKSALKKASAFDAADAVAASNLTVATQERRSTRVRKTPTSADAHVYIPEPKTPRKRKHSASAETPTKQTKR